MNMENTATTDLTFDLGKNDEGEQVRVNIGKLYSLMVAGTPDTRLRAFVRDMITEFVIHNSPENLKMIIIDCWIRERE